MASVPAQIADNSPSLVTIALDTTASEIVRCLSGRETFRNCIVLPEYIYGNSITDLKRRLDRRDVLIGIIDFDHDPRMAAESATVLQSAFSGRTTLVALSTEENPELILAAMRAGCNEYLRKPLQADGLSTCLQRLCLRWHTHSPGSDSAAAKVLAFMSVRGGAGATTLAVHLGTFLAQRQGRRVLLIDSHPNLGHAGMLLGLENQGYDFPEMARNIERMDLALLNSLVARHPTGLHLLRSPDQFSPNGGIFTPALERAIRFASGAYDFVLIDCPQGMIENNHIIATCCDEYYLVATPELPAVRDLSRYLEWLTKSGVPASKLKVVLNERDSQRAVTQTQIAEAIAHRVDYVLPFSPSDLVRAVATGEPVAPDRKSSFAAEVRKWASAQAPAQETHNENRRWFAFWS